LKVILYTKDFNETINEPVDIILSPQYYWIKKIDIPIKSLKNAKKLAKSMFKLNDNYLYDAFEIDGKFFAYAIDKNLKLNIDKKYINSIRLAQTELYKFDKINVSKNHSIQKIDDLLFCFPYVQNAPDINDILQNIKLSKNKVNLYGIVEIDKSILINIAVIFLFINVALLLIYIKNINSIKTIENKTETIIKKYNLPSTTFQLDSILSELKSINKKQTKLRKDLEFITKTPLKKGEKFKKLSYEKNRFSIVIDSSRNFDFYFKKRFKLSSEKGKEYKAVLYE